MIDGIRPRRRPGSQGSGAQPQSSRQMPVSDHAHSPYRFRPPAEVAAEDDAGNTNPEPTPENPYPDRDPGQPDSFWTKLRNLDKKQWVIIIAVAVVLLGGGVTAFLLTHKHKPQPVATKKATTVQKQAPPAPTTEASVTTGVQVDPAVNQRPVTGVMIENSEFARPQSGIDQADVVFEAVAEGGITRFLVLFHDQTPTYLGPVRSVRPYYIQWGLGFDAAIAHVGGSPEALQDMKTWQVKDLDQFANGKYFHRINSRDAPHNVYTSLAELNALETSRGYGKASFTSLARKKDAPATTVNASSLDFTISSSTFNTHYDYDKTTNSYKRSQAGAPHTMTTEQNVQTQLQPKVVVGLVMQQGVEADDLHTSYATIGSGQAYVFQDGTVTIGTWKKDSNNAQIILSDANGAPLKLDAGQTWFTAISAASKISYK
jgi:hypothetical protein